MKLVDLCLLSVALAVICDAAAAQTTPAAVPPTPPECGAAAPLTFANPATIAILDNAVASSSVVVSGAPPYLWDVGAVTDIVHPSNGQLTVTLTSPAGTAVTLTSKNGGGNANVFNGTVWDDQANPGGQVPYTINPGLVTDRSYVNGVTAPLLAPEEALAAFAGENPNGTWTLRVSDDAAGQAGLLEGWSLVVASLAAPPPVVARLSPSQPALTPILDNATATSAIDVPAGIGTRVCKVTVRTTIDHAAGGDLDVTLTSPSGTVVTLTTDNGGANDDVFDGTLWDDEADPGGQVPYVSNDGLATDHLYVNGVTATPLVPEEALGGFVGENPSGLWTLAVHDDTTGSTGTLQGWSLEITTCSCAQSFPAGPLRVDEHAAQTSSNLNGVLEPFEIVLVEPSWSNLGATPFTLVTYANSLTGPPGPTYTFVDSGAAYGTLAGLTTSNCFDATGDCYRVQIVGLRPLQHWDASFDEITAPIALTEAQQPYYSTWVLHVGDSFADVPRADAFYRYIETIFHLGVTGGGSCGGYCPAESALRKQMAVFLLKSADGADYLPPPATGIFIDVPASDPFAPWIEELYARGVAAGCGSGPRYCPNSAVPRQQMAVFLLKMLLGASYVPPQATGIFADVPPANPFASWVEDLYGRGIAAGCGAGLFCPTRPVTRGQMAVFLTKTFGLQLYGP